MKKYLFLLFFFSNLTLADTAISYAADGTYEIVTGMSNINEAAKLALLGCQENSNNPNSCKIFIIFL